MRALPAGARRRLYSEHIWQSIKWSESKKKSLKNKNLFSDTSGFI